MKLNGWNIEKPCLLGLFSRQGFGILYQDCKLCVRFPFHVLYILIIVVEDTDNAHVLALNIKLGPLEMENKFVR